MTERFLEDYEVGQVYGSGDHRVEPGRMTSFAEEFDPQPFHVSDTGAAGTIFGSMAASGWHTAAMTMKLLVGGELKPAGGIVGLGFEELRWPKPVRSGDVLRVESEILDARASRSQLDQGVIKVRVTTRNQSGEAVQIAVGTLLVRRRSAGR